MALGDRYAELAGLKGRLGITDTNNDTQLNAALSTASRSVERFCRRQFNTDGTATSRTFDPLDRFLVTVDDFHTTTGLEVAIDESGDGTFGTTLTSSEYQLEPLNGVVEGEAGWPFWKIRLVGGALFPLTHLLPISRRASVQVTAQWGWSEVPPAVKESTLIVAEETFKLKDAPFGVAGFGEFGAMRVRENPKVAQLLSPYRRTAVRVA